MIIKGTWCKNLRKTEMEQSQGPGSIRTLGITFEPIPAEGDPKPLYRVTCSLGPGLDFGSLLNAEEAEAGLKALVADGWLQIMAGPFAVEKRENI